MRNFGLSFVYILFLLFILSRICGSSGEIYAFAMGKSRETCARRAIPERRHAKPSHDADWEGGGGEGGKAKSGKCGLCRIAEVLSGALDKHRNTNAKWKENNLPGAAVKAGESPRRESIAPWTALKRMQIRTGELASVRPARKRARSPAIGRAKNRNEARSMRFLIRRIKRIIGLVAPAKLPTLDRPSTAFKSRRPRWT